MLAWRLNGRPASLSRAAHEVRRAGALDVRRHVGEQELQPLELADRPAELLALTGVRDRVGERRLGDPGRDRGDAEPAGVERRERDLHARALLADELGGGDPGAVEDHLRGDVAGEAHLLLGRAEGHARGVARHDERRQAALGVVGGAGEQDVVVGARAVADPLLGAVHDVLVAVAHRPGADAADVGAGLRLGEAVGAEPVAAEHPRQPLAAQVVAAVGVRRRSRSGRARSRRPRRSATRSRSPRPPAGRSRRAARRRRTPRGTAGSAGPDLPSSRYAASGNSPRSSASCTCGASSLVAISRVSSSSASPTPSSSRGSSRSTVVPTRPMMPPCDAPPPPGADPSHRRVGAKRHRIRAESAQRRHATSRRVVVIARLGRVSGAGRGRRG